LELTFIL